MSAWTRLRGYFAPTPVDWAAYPEPERADTAPVLVVADPAKPGGIIAVASPTRLPAASAVPPDTSTGPTQLLLLQAVQAEIDKVNALPAQERVALGSRVYWRVAQAAIDVVRPQAEQRAYARAEAVVGEALTVREAVAAVHALAFPLEAVAEPEAEGVAS